MTDTGSGVVVFSAVYTAVMVTFIYIRLVFGGKR